MSAGEAVVLAIPTAYTRNEQFYTASINNSHTLGCNISEDTYHSQLLLNNHHSPTFAKAQSIISSELRKRINIFQSQSSGLGVSEEECPNSFFIVDLGFIQRQFRRWQACLPRVEPFYAVKCNPDPLVIRTLARLGAGFDCASKTEIQQVLSLPENVGPERIIFANPCKASPQIKFAEQARVKWMTFDNADELYKCKKLHPNGELFLRIWTDDSKSLCQLSTKFGAPPATVRPLLKLAKTLGLNVVGVSFHVGSGSRDPMAFAAAVESARRAFLQGREVGYDFKILDIGGGFCHDDFERVALVLGRKIDELFPIKEGIRIIGEPGRYFVAGAFTLAANVIARRCAAVTIGGDETGYMYYLSDGVYGSFNCILYDHQTPYPRILSHANKFYYPSLPHTSSSGVKCSIWGPTCDGLDCITSSWSLPVVLEVGDWLYFEDMGAYTICAATRFNGFTASEVFYVCSEGVGINLLAEKELEGNI